LIVMEKRARRRIERSRPAYRWGLLKASLLFGVLLLAEYALIRHLVVEDLSRAHLMEAMSEYRKDAENFAHNVAEVLKREGKYDLFTVKEKVTMLTRRVGKGLGNRIALHHIAVYDAARRQVASFTIKSDIVVRPQEDGAAGGQTPVFHPVQELPLSPAEPGDRPLRLAGTELPEEHDPEEYGPPAPTSFHMDRVQRETVIIAPVSPNDEEGRQAGLVEVGIDQELLMAEVAQLRQDLLKKVAAGAFLSLVVLIVGFLYVLKLLQKTRRLEAEAQMADRLAYIGTLASGLAHEIRNPLNAMNMNLQLLEEDLGHSASSAESTEAGTSPASDEERRSLLEGTKGEIKRLDRMVGNFLAYARPSTPNVEERDLNGAVDEVVNFLRAEFASKGITITTRFEPGLPPAEIDKAQFTQAMLNILINAHQVLEPDGLIEIATTSDIDGQFLVRITDNGPGIPSEQLDKIFEVFYSTRRGGTGLGLPIAQRIVENHGGRIEVESQLGKGTTFRIVLPKRAPVQVAAEPAAEPARTG
jgi:signal transduction histidine kinase